MAPKTESKESLFILRIMSLLLALVMWVNFSGRVDVSNSTEKVFLNIPLIFQDKPEQIGIQNNQTTMVHVTLSGPERDMHKVTAADIQAGLSLAGRGRGEHTFPLNASNIKLPDRLKEFTVVAVIPDRINLTLEHITRKKLKLYVDTRGQPSSDYDYVGEVLNPPEVTIEGPTDRLKDITMLISRPVVIEGATADINGTFELARELPRGAFLLESLGQLRYQIQIREKKSVEKVATPYSLSVEIAPGEENWKYWKPVASSVNLVYSGPVTLMRWFRPEWVAPKIQLGAATVNGANGKAVEMDATQKGKTAIVAEWLIPEQAKRRAPDWQDRLKRIELKWEPAQMEVVRK